MVQNLLMSLKIIMKRTICPSKGVTQDILKLDYGKFTPLLLGLCKRQQSQIDDLLLRIEQLENR